METLADELRSTKAKFHIGSWRLTNFHASLECQHWKSESMWQLQQQFYQTWGRQFPKSITAQVAHAQFMENYA